MNLLSIAIKQKITLGLLLCMLPTLIFSQQPTLKLAELVEYDNNQVRVFVTAYDFNDLIGMQ